MPDESQAAGALIEVMEAEGRLCRRLLAYAEAKREALIAADVERLYALLPEMSATVSELGALEAQRLEQVRMLTGSSAPETVPLDALTARVAGRVASRLESLKQELGPLLQRVRELCSGNLALARQGAALSDRCLRLLTDADGGLYSADGAVASGATARHAWTA